MRILHISTRLILGGSQENTVLSCEGQARLGHDVHLAFGPIYGPEGSMLARVEKSRRTVGYGEGLQPTLEMSEARADWVGVEGRDVPRRSPGRWTAGGITTHVVPHLVREISPVADVRAYWELRRLIRALKPDVVHTHSSKAGVLGRMAAWDEYARNVAMDPASPPAQDVYLWKCRVVHTIHGPPFMPVEAGDSVVRRLKTRVNNGVYTLAERYAARKCHAIVSVADAMTREFLRRGIGRPEQYTTVYSGMETERFLVAAMGEDRASVRGELGFADGDFVIGTVGRLAQHKGHDDILDALGADLRANPHWRLLWVGDGWWRERLMAKAASVGAREGQIVLTGLVPPESVPAMMRAMDVLVHASSREGLPRTVPQAQLCGVVPIAYDCDGTPEAIVDRAGGDRAEGERSTGMLVRTGDVEGLRGAVRWAADPGHRAELVAMGARGRVSAAERFGVGKMVQGLEQIYAESDRPPTKTRG